MTKRRILFDYNNETATYRDHFVGNLQHAVLIRAAALHNLRYEYAGIGLVILGRTDASRYRETQTPFRLDEAGGYRLRMTEAIEAVIACTQWQ